MDRKQRMFRIGYAVARMALPGGGWRFRGLADCPSCGNRTLLALHRNHAQTVRRLAETWDNPPAYKRALEERDALQELITRQGQNFRLAPWDWRYYAEKLRQEKYDFDAQQLQPYFQLSNLIDAAFFTARKLFGLPPENVHIRSPFLGGGFGSKGLLSGPQVLGILAARLVGRPVKLVLRREQMYGPVGHRAPWFEINPGTPDLLAAHGLLYSASLMGDDVPFVHANGLVEIPGQWMLEDWEQFAFNAEPAWGFVPENCEKVYDLWMREYEAMRDFGCCFVLTLHPWLSGRPSRVRLLERIVRDIQADGTAWFASGAEIARYVLARPDARRETDLG